MRVSKASRRQVLAPLSEHVDEHSVGLERALKGLWKAQQASPRSDHEEGYRTLAEGKLGKAWAAATAAGSNAAYPRLDAPAQSWISIRARWFVGVMADQQARTIRAVGAQARDIAPSGAITSEEIAEYKRLSVGLTERDILAVMRYGATLKAALENKDVRKAILPGAVAEYARRLAASRAATIAATELAAAFNAGKIAAYRMAQGLGLDIGSDDEEREVSDVTEGGQSKRSILREALAGGISAAALADVPKDEESPQYEKVWVTVDDPCPECEALEGQTVSVDEEFEDGDPPLHANCRCSVEVRKTGD